jgi:hypothetical protein
MRVTATGCRQPWQIDCPTTLEPSLLWYSQPSEELPLVRRVPKDTRPADLTKTPSSFDDRAPSANGHEALDQQLLNMAAASKLGISAPPNVGAKRHATACAVWPRMK